MANGRRFRILNIFDDVDASDWPQSLTPRFPACG
jgi:hypothetical protein